MNVLAVCDELDRIAFCIWRIIDSHLSPTSSFIFCSTSFKQPPRTSMMMLYWLTLFSIYWLVSSSVSWLYFVVYSKSLDSLFSSHGQLIKNYYSYYYFIFIIITAFRARKVIGTFKKQAPGAHNHRRAKSRRFHGPVYS